MAKDGLILLMLGGGALALALLSQKGTTTATATPRPENRPDTTPFTQGAGGGGPAAGAPIGPGTTAVGLDPAAVAQIQAIAQAGRAKSQAQGGLDRQQRLEIAAAILKAAAQGTDDPDRKQAFLDKLAEIEAQIGGA